jgi:hypothetical protein
MEKSDPSREIHADAFPDDTVPTCESPYFPGQTRRTTRLAHEARLRLGAMLSADLDQAETPFDPARLGFVQDDGSDKGEYQTWTVLVSARPYERWHVRRTHDGYDIARCLGSGADELLPESDPGETAYTGRIHSHEFGERLLANMGFSSSVVAG